MIFVIGLVLGLFFYFWFTSDQKNDADDQTSLGLRYANGEGMQQSDAEAVSWFRKAAERGDVDAQFNLGVMYDNGRGVPQSHPEAAMWFRKAARQGEATAQHKLGVMYENGKGVPKDYAEAVKWYRKAIEHGYAAAQSSLDHVLGLQAAMELSSIRAAEQSDAEDCGGQVISDAAIGVLAAFSRS